MVTILPPKTNVGSQIGQAIGQGLQQSLPQGMQMGFQRGMLRNALSNVRNLSQQKDVKPLDIALSLMEAGAGIPGSERYLATLLPMLMQSAQVSNMPPFGAQGQAQPGQQPPSQQGQQAQGSAIPSETQQIPQGATGEQTQPSSQPITLGNFVPLDVGNLVSPEQQQNILRQVGETGGDINLAKSLINDYNKGKIDFNELVNSNVDRAWAQKQKELQLESNLSNFVSTKIGANEPEGFKSVAYNMMKPFVQQGMDLNSAWLRAEPQINNFKRELSNFEKAIPEADFFKSELGFGPEEVNKWFAKGKAITDKYPAAYPILQNFFTNKGHNPIAVAHALNPLGKDMSTVIDASKDYKPELYTPSGFGGKGPDIEGIFNKQQAEIPKMAEKLSKNWNPNTSIIGIYGQLRDKGWLPNNIHPLIDSLRQMVKFSSQQDVEANEVLQNPPLPLFERSRFRKK